MDLREREREQWVVGTLSRLRRLDVGEGLFAIEHRDSEHGRVTRLGVLSSAGTKVFETVLSQSSKSQMGWVIALPYEQEGEALIGYAAASLLVSHEGGSPIVVGDRESPAYKVLQQMLDFNTYSPDSREALHAKLTWHTDHRIYDEQVRDVVEWCVSKGNAVVCLTNRARVEVCDEVGAAYNIDPVVVYEQLIRKSPSPYQAIINMGGRALVSVSPEAFLRVCGGEVRSQPMKGTRPRGATPETDRLECDSLIASLKERAENSAVTQTLMREFEAVCSPGSVSIEEEHRILSFAQVHQMVSDVRGTLDTSVTLGQLLQAVFPAASMTGVPKAEAMSIIQRLERGPRGLYSGCYGWVGECGDVELAMSIRCAEISGNTATIGAGGGITALSEPEEEIAEVRLKARAVLEAVAPGITAEGEAETQR